MAQGPLARGVPGSVEDAAARRSRRLLELGGTGRVAVPPVSVAGAAAISVVVARTRSTVGAGSGWEQRSRYRCRGGKVGRVWACRSGVGAAAVGLTG